MQAGRERAESQYYGQLDEPNGWVYALFAKNTPETIYLP
jgi:hypothetical protein